MGSKYASENNETFKMKLRLVTSSRLLQRTVFLVLFVMATLWRFILRMDGVSTKEKERSQDIIEQVVGMLEEASARNVDGCIDRIHGIGKTCFDKKSSKKCMSIIVRFTTLRYLTIACRLKKNMKDIIEVHDDLTKKRHSLLKSVSYLVRDLDDILFCHADINCCLNMTWKDEPREDHFFTSIDDLKDLSESLI